MSLYQAPPEAVIIGGRAYPIDTDFRIWMEFQTVMTAKGTNREKAERICSFLERQGLPTTEEALDAALAFFEAASHEKNAGGQKKRPAAFNFEKDSEYIYAAFKGAYGIDLDAAQLHWWKFKALFKALPDDCEFVRIMRYRTMDLKDVPKSQRRFYQEQKTRYSLGGGTVHWTEKDMRDYVKRRYREAQNQMSALRSGGQPNPTGEDGAGI